MSDFYNVHTVYVYMCYRSSSGCTAAKPHTSYSHPHPLPIHAHTHLRGKSLCINDFLKVFQSLAVLPPQCVHGCSQQQGMGDEHCMAWRVGEDTQYTGHPSQHVVYTTVPLTSNKPYLVKMTWGIFLPWQQQFLACNVYQSSSKFEVNWTLNRVDTTSQTYTGPYEGFALEAPPDQMPHMSQYKMCISL